MNVTVISPCKTQAHRQWRSSFKRHPSLEANYGVVWQGLEIRNGGVCKPMFCFETQESPFAILQHILLHEIASKQRTRLIRHPKMATV